MKTKKIDEKLRKTLSDDIMRIIGPHISELIETEKYRRVVDGVSHINMSEVFATILRRAVTMEARSDNDDLLYALAAIVTEWVHKKASSDGLKIDARATMRLADDSAEP